MKNTFFEKLPSELKILVFLSRKDLYYKDISLIEKKYKKTQ